MQLNEIHNPHEHASVSLKVILLVFAVILVGVLGYLVWDYNNAPDTTDYSSTTIKKTDSSSAEEADETADWKQYSNDEFGFELTLTSAWEGYKTRTRTDTTNPKVKYIDFFVPCGTNECTGTDIPGYASRFVIQVLPLAERDKRLVAQDPSKINKTDELGQTSIYAFYPAEWQDPPESLISKNFNIEQIKNSFKLID